MIVVYVLFALNILFFAFEYISFRLNGEGINDSVFYHLLKPMDGVGFQDFKFEIFIVIFVLFFLTLVCCVFRKCQINRRDKLLLIGFLSILMVFNSGVIKTIEYTKSLFSYEIKKPVDYLEFEATLGNQKNLFFIYLESFENTYTNESVFPGLTPNINNYKKNGLTFENVDMVTGSGWTIAGMVASQCGLPLVTSAGSGNSMGQSQKFLPNANCLGDILKNYGYKNYYYGGADTKFAGKKNFYTDHGFDEISGLSELQEREEVNAKSGWGIYDDELFEIIKNDFKKLDKNQKYAWFVLNVDTHHPFGHVSSSCKDINYGDGKIKILNAVHCTDFLLKKFVDSISQSDPNAMIVIASDHLAMPNDARAILVEQERKNLFLLLNTQQPSKKIKSAASTYDIAPTVLALMGFQNEGLGWGRNLIKNSSLISNFSDVEGFNDYVESYRNFNKSFHGYYQAFRTLKKQDGYFMLNGERIKEPFAIKIDKNKYIKDIYFHGDDEFDEYLMKVIGEIRDGSVIIVDECNRINLNKKEDNICYLISNYKWGADKGGVFNEDIVINDEFAIESWSDFEKIENNFNEYIYPGAEIIHINENINVDSNSFGGNESRIETNKQTLKINRGIGFYSVDHNGVIEGLDFKDFCDDAETAVPSDRLLNFIRNKTYQVNNFIYVVHDSAWCNKGKYLQFNEDLGMDIFLQEIGFREAAIYIRKGEKINFEKSPNRVLTLPLYSN